MSELLWVLIGLILIIGLIGGYYQLMLVENIKHQGFGKNVMGGWVFNPKDLTEKGKHYRNKIFICWALAGLIIVIIKISG